MKVIDFAQNMIKNAIEADEILENVYISPKRNSEYPYCIIIVESVEDVSNIKETMFVCLVSLDIYDKNTDSNGVNEISENIKNGMNSLINMQNDTFAIKNITFERGNLKLFNELNLVWNIDIKFKFLIKKL
jgi:hypothetical protein